MFSEKKWKTKVKESWGGNTLDEIQSWISSWGKRLRAVCRENGEPIDHLFNLLNGRMTHSCTFWNCNVLVYQILILAFCIITTGNNGLNCWLITKNIHVLSHVNPWKASKCQCVLFFAQPIKSENSYSIKFANMPDKCREQIIVEHTVNSNNIQNPITKKLQGRIINIWSSFLNKAAYQLNI